MKIYIYFILCVTFYTDCSTAYSGPESLLRRASEATLSEDGKLNFTQLVIKYGKTVEQYDVVTEDGYILTVFRIPGPKPPVLLFHGIATSSDSFIVRTNTSLVMALATECYDVWVGNNRGNLYGRNHVSLNPDTDKKFWDFSLQEIGYYDLAATIDFVRKVTGADKICTVGHSQGTTAHFVLASLRPQYNERIKVFIALAPVAYMNNMPPPLSTVAPIGPAISTLLKLAGIEELLQNHKATSDLITFICSKGVVSYLVCGWGVLYPFAGFDPAVLEPEFLSVLFGHYPSGISRKSLQHYDQIILRRSFAQFDYGSENIFKYGSLDPPEYDLNSVTLKVALFVAKADKLATVENVERLRDTLPNVVYYKIMEPEQWGHFDFVVGKEMPKYLTLPILDLLEKYN